MKFKMIYLLMVCTAIIWGSTFVMSKIAVSFVPATVAASIRWGLAAIMITPVFLLMKKRTPINGNWWRLFVHAFIGIVLYNLFLFMGVAYAKASLDEPITSIQIIGVSLMILGVWAIHYDKQQKISPLSNRDYREK